MALGIFKTGLRARGIALEVHYANLRFSDEIGAALHHALAWSSPAGQLGEWTFSGAAFPEFETDHAEYLDMVLDSNWGLGLAAHLPRGTDVKEPLLRVREAAAGFVDTLAREIVESGARVVGCSTVFQQHCASLALLRRIKRLEPSTVTILGGANCEGVMGQTTVDHFEWVDYAFSGEADHLFPEFCQRLLDRPTSTPPDHLTDLPPSILVAGEGPRGRGLRRVLRRTRDGRGPTPVPRQH